MNTSQFMDKQIMDLSNSQNRSSNNNNDFIDLINHPEEDQRVKNGEILPNYDFQPIRPLGSSNFDSNNASGATRVLNSDDSKSNSGFRNYDSLDSAGPAKVIVEKDQNGYDAVLISEIDRTVKKHADNLLHALEGVSARLSQLESRSRHLENSVDDLKSSVGNNYGSTDGKLRQIENIIREVQAGVQVVRDKQEILDSQLQLSKVQILKVEQQQQETQSSFHMEPIQQSASAPLQSHKTQSSFHPEAMQQSESAPLQSHSQHPPPVALTQPPPTLSPPNAPPAPMPQNLPPPMHLSNQFSQNMPPIPQSGSYFPPSGQTPEGPNQPYQLSPPQQLPPPAPSPPQPQYQPPVPHPQYSLAPPPMPQQLPPPNPSQTQFPVGHHSEETTYLPSQSYPPNVRQPSGAPPSQQFYGTPSHMYEQPSSRPGSGFPGTYGPSSGHGEPYPYGGSPSQYGPGSPMKSQQHSSPNVGPSGGSGYPQLPTARSLPHALPTASGISGGSGSSSGTGNRVPIDDVVDKVTNMGFSRDQVRATVRKLTENGQAVDLNVVLDKLMNDGVESQPQRGWFGR